MNNNFILLSNDRFNNKLFKEKVKSYIKMHNLSTNFLNKFVFNNFYFFQTIQSFSVFEDKVEKQFLLTNGQGLPSRSQTPTWQALTPGVNAHKKQFDNNLFFLDFPRKDIDLTIKIINKILLSKNKSMVNYSYIPLVVTDYNYQTEEKVSLYDNGVDIIIEPDLEIDFAFKQIEILCKRVW